MDRDITLYLAGQLEVLLRELPRTLDGLATARGEEDSVEVAWRVIGDALGQFDRRRGGERPQREEREGLSLLGRRLGEFGAAVADLHDEQPRQAVDELVAVAVPDVDALAAGDDRRGDVVAVAGEVAPEVALGLGGHVGVNGWI
jgi:hypothetical protein